MHQILSSPSFISFISHQSLKFIHYSPFTADPKACNYTNGVKPVTRSKWPLRAVRHWGTDPKIDRNAGNEVCDAQNFQGEDLQTPPPKMSPPHVWMWMVMRSAALMRHTDKTPLLLNLHVKSSQCFTVQLEALKAQLLQWICLLGGCSFSA